MLFILANDHEIVQLLTDDEQEIPITLVKNKVEAWWIRVFIFSPPTLVLVYGAYGSNLSPFYRPDLVPLIHSGWSIALLHIRWWIFKQIEEVKKKVRLGMEEG